MADAKLPDQRVQKPMDAVSISFPAIPLVAKIDYFTQLNRSADIFLAQPMEANPSVVLFETQ